MQLAGSATCVPTWSLQIDHAKREAKQRRIRSFHVPGCDYDAELGIVPCDPNAMRSATERALHRLRLVADDYSLSFEVYAIARNIASEASSGSSATRVAIAEAALNRAAYHGWPLARVLMKDGQHFGRQRGQNPPVSTRQDPTWQDIVAAEVVVRGETGNFARGATHYFSPSGMDWIRAKGGQDNRFTVYNRWSQWGAWVGAIPGINHNKQFLMNASASDEDRVAMAPVGRAALQYLQAPKIAAAPSCSSAYAGAGRGTVIAVVGLAVVGAGTLAAIAASKAMR